MSRKKLNKFLVFLSQKSLDFLINEIINIQNKPETILIKLFVPTAICTYPIRVIPDIFPKQLIDEYS